jgi:hypothetical protein
MRKILPLLLLVIALFAVTSGAAASPPDSRNFTAVLSGANEVPARDTLARGVAVFHFSPDGAVLDYRLIAANLENVTASHIHCASAGVNGPVGLTLYMGAAGSGRVDGALASRSVSAPDPGNGCGWQTLADVEAAMLSGNAYVNVHTNDGVAPTNTGPGDFPGGEIRGQVAEHGPSN